MKMQSPNNITSICVEGTTYTPDKKGLIEAQDEHGQALMGFGFTPVDASVVMYAEPTQEDIDLAHKAKQALLFIEAWNKDHPEAPIGPGVEEAPVVPLVPIVQDKAGA
jgi:hypothetical protein